MRSRRFPAFSVENRHRGPRRVCGPLLGWKTPLHNGRQEFLAANKLHRSINDTVELDRLGHRLVTLTDTSELYLEQMMAFLPGETPAQQTQRAARLRGEGARLRLVDVQSGRTLRISKLGLLEVSKDSRIMLSPDGKILLCLPNSGQLRLISLKNQSEFGAARPHPSPHASACPADYLSPWCPFAKSTALPVAVVHAKDSADWQILPRAAGIFTKNYIRVSNANGSRCPNRPRTALANRFTFAGRLPPQSRRSHYFPRHRPRRVRLTMPMLERSCHSPPSTKACRAPRR